MPTALLITGKTESLIIVCIIFGIICTLTFKNIPDVKKPAQIALFLQFIICALCLFCMILIVGVPTIDCKVTSMFEFVFYNLFLVTMESVLLLRGIAFTRYDKYLKYVTVALWVIRLCIGGYQVSTIVSISEVNDYCVFSADFSVSIHQLWLQILTEVILLLPFLEKMYQMIQSATATGISGDGNRKELLHLSIHNTFCTALVIAAQIASTYINGIQGMAPYINAVFAIVDAVQALAVMNAMDVLKNTFINMSNSSRNRNQTPVHSSGYQLSQSNECD